MRRLLATATTIALVAVGAVASTAHAAQLRERQGYSTISWGPCKDASLQAHDAECGMVTVPLDYLKPKGATIQVAVSRIKHTVPEKDYQGVMLVNPGGPGASGLGMAVIGSLVPGDKTGGAYDWIGFDPRGVGDSKPSLTCDPSYQGYNRPPYVPSSPALENSWLARSKAYADACAKAGGDLLNHMKTIDTVKDMETIRLALGVEQINYYGFSYGTYIGQVYATMHPDRVRRMVLDGNVDPTRVWYDSNLDQDLAFDRNIKTYFRWIAENHRIYHLGRTEKAVETLYYSEMAELKDAPAGGVIGPDELTDVFLQPGYYVFGWEDVARAFSAWVNKQDSRPLKNLYDKGASQKPGGDNNYAVYLAVQCSDVQWPTDWAKWQKDNWAMNQKAPFETWGNAWYNAPCRDWPAKPGIPVTISGETAPPILLLSEQYDAATPFTGSLEVRNRFPKSSLVEGVGGTTHAGSLFGDDCVDDTVAAYLATGALPKRVDGNRADKKCPPIPQPDPSGSAGTPKPPTGKRAAPAVPAARLELQRIIAGR